MATPSLVDRNTAPSVLFCRAAFGPRSDSPHHLSARRGVTLRSIKGFGLPLLQKLARALMFDEEY
jgi:hypothetical protein